MTKSTAHDSDDTDVLERRFLSAIDALAQSDAANPPESSQLGGDFPWAEAAAGRFITTGIGASEAIARFFVTAARAALQARGARFAPVSELASDSPPVDLPESILVVCSQGLSPNGCLALRHARHAKAVLCVTAASDAEWSQAVSKHLPGTPVRMATIHHGPAQEAGFLVRLAGPLLARWEIARFMASLSARCGRSQDGQPGPFDAKTLRDVPSTLRAVARHSASQPISPDAPIALIVTGEYDELARGFAWKLMEGLCIPHPPVWDALAFAHGPFQAYYDRPLTLLALRRPDAPREPEIFQRLQDMLAHDRHRLLTLDATLSSPLCALEHDVATSALLISTLRTHPRELRSWPGRGADGPIYSLDR